MKTSKNYLPLLGVAAVVTLLVAASYALITASKKTVGEGKASATVTSTVTTDPSAATDSVETVPAANSSASSYVKQGYEIKHVNSSGEVTGSEVLKPDYYGSAEAMAIDSEGNPVFMIRRSLEDTKIVRNEDGINKVVESCEKLCQIQGLASNSQGDFAYLIRDLNGHLKVVLHTADGEVTTRTYCVQSEDEVRNCIYKKYFPSRELHSSTLAITNTGKVFLSGKVQTEEEEEEVVYIAEMYESESDLEEYGDGDSIEHAPEYLGEFDSEPFKLAAAVNGELFATSTDQIGRYKNVKEGSTDNRYYFKPRISGFLKGMAVDRDDSVYLLDTTESDTTLQTFTPRGRLLEAVDLSDHFDLSQSRNLLLASGNDAGVYVAGPSTSLDSDI